MASELKTVPAITAVAPLRTMFFLYTGVGGSLSFPKVPGLPSASAAGPPTKFTTTDPVQLHNFNSPATLFQDPGASLGSASVLGNLQLSITAIKGIGNTAVLTRPGIITIKSGDGFQLPGLGSTTQGVLASSTEDLPFTGYK